MAVSKRKYDARFKQEALRLLAVSGKSVRQIEAELGITQGLLNKGKPRYRLHPTTGEVQPSQLHELEAENRRLRRELKPVKAERDLLKKVVKLFSVDMPRGIGSSKGNAGDYRSSELVGGCMSRRGGTMLAETTAPGSPRVTRRGGWRGSPPGLRKAESPRAAHG